MTHSLFFLKQDNEQCARPRLDIIHHLPDSYEEISSDALSVRGFQENECRDYSLGKKWAKMNCFMLPCLKITID